MNSQPKLLSVILELVFIVLKVDLDKLYKSSYASDLIIFAKSN